MSNNLKRLRMKKHILLLAGLAVAVSLAGCGDSASSSSTASVSETPVSISISEEPVVVSVSEEEPVVEENHDGEYRSELTNEWISEDIKSQRPIAVMIDNESVPLPHYGTSDADIVYELMNSTANGRITRLMCIFKDYEATEVIGNIRSVRPTNIILAPEYNAILVHDGGPFYINEWFEYDNAGDHLSSGFARIDRGNASYYEEYATSEHYEGTGEYAGNSYKSIAERIEAAGYEKEYNEYFMGKHFTFSDDTYKLSDENSETIEVSEIDLPYQHNDSKLIRNEETGLYEYYEYGELYVDALYDNRSMAFENLIVITADYVQYDENGYMCYYAIGSGEGYYITEGEAIPIRWNKPDMYSLTTYVNGYTGEEIVLNTGKTYITIVPLDVWDDVVMK